MRLRRGGAGLQWAVGVTTACSALLAASGCGAEAEPAGPLRWHAGPEVAESEVEGDWIVSGEVRNSSLEPIEIRADDLVVVDEGEEFATDTTFLAGYGRGFVETSRGYADADDVPESEQVRAGRLLKLPPGGTTSVVVAWRGGGADADGVRYPLGYLPIER